MNNKKKLALLFMLIMIIGSTMVVRADGVHFSNYPELLEAMSDWADTIIYNPRGDFQWPDEPVVITLERDIDLNGNEWVIPSNVTIVYNGHHISNGTLIIKGTAIINKGSNGSNNFIPGYNIKISVDGIMKLTSGLIITSGCELTVKGKVLGEKGRIEVSGGIIHMDSKGEIQPSTSLLTCDEYATITGNVNGIKDLEFWSGSVILLNGELNCSNAVVGTCPGAEVVIGKGFTFNVDKSTPEITFNWKVTVKDGGVLNVPKTARFNLGKSGKINYFDVGGNVPSNMLHQKIKMKVSSRNYKFSNMKKKSVTFNIGAKAIGKLRYTTSNKRYIKVTSKGKVTVKKGIPKGVYFVYIDAQKSGKYMHAISQVTIRVK